MEGSLYVLNWRFRAEIVKLIGVQHRFIVHGANNFGISL